MPGHVRCSHGQFVVGNESVIFAAQRLVRNSPSHTARLVELKRGMDGGKMVSSSSRASARQAGASWMGRLEDFIRAGADADARLARAVKVMSN